MVGLEKALELSDQELVNSARGGDVESFRKLYERHYAMAVALAACKLHDRHLAEDAAQEAFVVACRQLATLKDGRRFAQWLGTIVRRTAMGMFKSRVSGKAIHADYPAPEDGADDLAEVRNAIQSLPTTQREIIYLRYFSELSYQEIAEAVETTVESVHGRLQRARRNLTKKLGKGKLNKEEVGKGNLANQRIGEP